MASLWDILILPVSTTTETLVGGTVDFYYPGTTGESNRKAVYTDKEGTTAAANPYTLGANASAYLYGSGDYHVVIKDIDGNTEYDFDYISPGGGSGVVSSDAFASVAAMGATTLTSGAIYETNGYYAVGDGGAGKYIIKTAAAYGTTPDGKLDFYVNGGTHVAERLNDASLTVLQAGGVSGAADSTDIIQAILDKGVEDVYIEGGTWNVDQLTIGTEGQRIYISRNATVKFSTWNQTGVFITANNVKITGGGTFESPATFDGTNSAWTYAVFYVTGDNLVVEDVVFENIPRVGIGLKDATGARVQNCRIIGNFPELSYTGINTAQFGVCVDTPASPGLADTVITGNYISGCVQGVFLGNFGTAAYASNIVIANNVFFNCWNHGIYNAGGAEAIAVSGNAFTRCQIPIVLTGKYNSVTGNTLTTYTTGNDVDLTGISLRNSSNCIVTGNTIQGDAGTNATIIDVRSVNVDSLDNNIIANNVIKVTGGSSTAIAIGALADTAHNNIISGNIIETVGRDGAGVITINTTDDSKGNIITGNRVTVQGPAFGISVVNAICAEITNNSISFEYDAPSAKTLASVYLGSVVYSVVSGNILHNQDAYGANVTHRGIWENSGCDRNRMVNNRYKASTGFVSGTKMVLLSGSLTVIDEDGSGVPAINAGIGSMYRDTAGGTGTTLYIKESGTDATGWVAK